MSEYGEKYYTKFGFTHLTAAGKVGFTLIFAVAAWLVWRFYGVFEWTGQEIEPPILESGIEYGLTLLIMAVAGTALAYVGVFLFLPRKRYARQEFYCASCGDFLDYRIVRCSTCGSNKYTVDPDLAAIRAEQKDKEIKNKG